MALRYSFDQGDEATRLEQAVEGVLADGLRTADLLGEDGATPISTGQMARLVHAYLTQHPDDLDRWDTELILDAFNDAYPCR